MSDKLKEFISSHEDQFDSSPMEGHFERFKKLQSTQQVNKSNEITAKKENNWVLLKVAAVLVLMLGSGWLFFNLGKMQASNTVVASSSASDNSANFNEELTEAEFFFTGKINSKKEEVLAFSGKDNPATSQIMLELEKLELQYIDLKEELSINDNNPKIINAMVENYRMRLSLLERLLEQLKKSNTIKQKRHDEVQA